MECRSSDPSFPPVPGRISLVRRRFTQLIRLMTWTLHGITAVLMFGALICLIGPWFSTARIHLIWIWLPFGDWRFRLMTRDQGLEIRTCFGSATHDYAPAIYLAFYLAWLAFAVTFLNCVVRFFEFVILEITKPKLNGTG
jgi:hypothetical protein